MPQSLWQVEKKKRPRRGGGPFRELVWMNVSNRLGAINCLERVTSAAALITLFLTFEQ